MEIGKMIRHYREKRGLTQKELAEKIHVSQRTIGHYETGERSPNINILELLAKSLYIGIGDFFKPIPKEEVKYRFYEHAWLYHYDEENEMHEFLDDTHFKEDIVRRYFITHIGKDIVYFFLKDIDEVVEGGTSTTKSSLELRGEIIPIVRLIDSVEKGYVIIRKRKDGKETKTAIPVDEFVELVDGIKTCDRLNKATKERKRKDEEIDKLNLTCLNLSINAARIDNKELHFYVTHENACDFSHELNRGCFSSVLFFFHPFF